MKFGRSPSIGPRSYMRETLLFFLLYALLFARCASLLAVVSLSCSLAVWHREKRALHLIRIRLHRHLATD